MPVVEMSSSRPTNGLTKVAPAFAASSACAAENTSVTLTRMPSPERALVALMPSRVSGHFTTMCGSILAMSWPSRIMPAKSVAVTSPLTGPLTMSQIFLRLARKSPGSFASSDGLVVTPSRMPSAAIVSISLMLPVSTNSFMAGLLFGADHSSACGLFDRFARLADIPGLVDGHHRVYIADAGAQVVVEKRRVRDRLWRDALEVGVGPASQHI